jgi:choline dehydrogenase-like flavoprotein
MFHLNEMFAIWPGRAFRGPSKAVGLRDLYHVGGQRFGMVQAMGIEASYGEITHYLRTAVERTVFRPLAGLARIPALIGSKLLGNAKVFVGLMEDLPYPENRVTFDPAAPGQISFDYRMHPELLNRRKQFRGLIRRAFKGLRPMFLTHMPELNFGHPCGTARFGTDPANSVLNPDCRAHSVDNLWIVDASFFPTAMGVNPSLTIAANALRVADVILAQD